MAATTLINHALGANNLQQASRWGWDVVCVSLALMCLLSAPLFFFPTQILTLFMGQSPLVAEGITPLRLTALGMILDSAALVLTQALLGTGCNRTVLRIRFTTLWLIALPLTWVATYPLSLG